MIRGVGVDIVEIPRVERVIGRWGEVFLRRVFTDAERRHAGAPPGATQHLAGRFAAKEAVMKALGTGWRGMAWREVEIASDPSGNPVVRLTGRAAEVASARRIGSLAVSISHTHALATALAVAE
ncbi:MAG TPA: holo-ACP synthase [bacterium]|nr:holo-ACP synthase [bacterium]